MMRSLYSGVSGLNNHQTRMDVLGNNISNVNTVGFKKGRVNFQDLLSQTITGASRPTEVRGGTNPKQVGLGMTVATIDTIHQQGSLQTTGVNTDLSILGDGFFIQKTGTKTSYTRNGSFSVDASGMLVNPSNGVYVQGFSTIDNPDGSTTIDTQGGISNIRIPLGEKSPAEKTEIVKFRSNLSTLTATIPENATDDQVFNGTWRTSIEVIDSEGFRQELQLSFNKSMNGTEEIPNSWNVQLAVVDRNGRAVNDIFTNVNPEGQNNSNQFTLTFNTAGAIIGVQDGLNNPIDPENATNPGDLVSVNLAYQIDGVELQDINLDLGSAGLYNGITQFASPSSASAFYQDGLEMGYLESFLIDNTGTIVGSYTNSAKKEIGRLALATFTNAGGLSKLGETSFVETPNSGQANILAPTQQSAGAIQAGALEMSNVDLATEFTDMIVTQRGFQANSRTITTSDTMLQELLQLKR